MVAIKGVSIKLDYLDLVISNSNCCALAELCLTCSDKNNVVEVCRIPGFTDCSVRQVLLTSFGANVRLSVALGILAAGHRRG